jgi:hypothetical protein
MKKIMVLSALMLLAVFCKAANEMDYVIIEGKTYFSDDIRIGMSHASIALENGLRLKAPLELVDVYMVNGKLCERLPIVCSDGEVKCTALMELVCMRNGLKLFKCDVYTGIKNLGASFRDEKEHEVRYFVYKDGMLHLRVDEKNAANVFDFFHLSYLSNK